MNSARLAELGITLPPVTPPVAAYIPANRAGDQVRTSGQLPMLNGALPATGKVGSDVTPDEAKSLARIAALNAIAAAADVAGGIDNLGRVLHVTVFVASSPDFTGQALVANGASELLSDVFGEAGIHSRSAVGVAVLPLDTPVEVEVLFEVA